MRRVIKIDRAQQLPRPSCKSVRQIRRRSVWGSRPSATAFRSTVRRMRVWLHFGMASRSSAVFQLRSGGALLGLARFRRGDEFVFTGTFLARFGRRL
ncbi:MAG TPA: hypothetical protein VJ810_08160 [Blastocatellia bacterium]|nr:hypothetical protein [Blastocatellia bacterium]